MYLKRRMGFVRVAIQAGAGGRPPACSACLPALSLLHCPPPLFVPGCSQTSQSCCEGHCSPMPAHPWGGCKLQEEPR